MKKNDYAPLTKIYKHLTIPLNLSYLLIMLDKKNNRLADEWQDD